MTEKRYAIVRVDYNCPKDVFHEFNFCLLSKGKTLVDICNHCDFLAEKRIIGDTKKQMIKKVATAILRTLKDGEVLKYEEFGTGFIKQVVSVEYLAKEIVEFLGVEE